MDINTVLMIFGGPVLGLALGLILRHLVKKIYEKRKQEEDKKKELQVKEAEERRKQDLIKKYGEQDGLIIFKGKISEEEFLSENKLKEFYKMFRQKNLDYEANEDFIALLEKHMEPSKFPSADWMPQDIEQKIIKKAENSFKYAILFLQETEGVEEITSEQWESYGKEKTSFNDPVTKKVKEIVNKPIIDILKEKAIKMPASDIDAFLKHQNVNEIKKLCEEMYHNGEISRTANYRYFILREEKKKPTKASVPKSEVVDVKTELKKFKEMLDEGLITQEMYDAKAKELLGL